LLLVLFLFCFVLFCFYFIVFYCVGTLMMCRYGVKCEGHFTLKFTEEGEFTVGGDINLEIAAKNTGDIYVEVECQFDVNHTIAFKGYFKNVLVRLVPN